MLSLSKALFIIKRMIYENSDFPQSRIQTYQPASGKPTMTKVGRTVDDFINSDVTRMGKEIQESGGFGIPPSVFEPKLATSAPSIVTGQGLEGMEDVFKNQALQAQKDAEAQKLLEAEQIAMREKEKQTAVEGGMPMPGQV